MKSLKKFKSVFDEDSAMGAGAIAANRTGNTPNMAMPPDGNRLGTVRRKYRQFNVESATFRKFQAGRMKFERWSKFLDMQNETHNEIYNYAKKNRDHVVVLKDDDTGALRAIRRPSANGS